LINEEPEEKNSTAVKKLKQILDIVQEKPGQIMEKMDTQLTTINEKFDAMSEKLSALEETLHLANEGDDTTALIAASSISTTQQQSTSTGSFIAHCGLGLADGRIQDNDISASGQHSSSYSKNKVRLYGIAYSWMKTGSSWIQVDLKKSVNISGIITQGDATSRYWVLTFKVMYGEEVSKLKYVEDHNGHEIFSGNTNSHEPRTTYFLNWLTARYIRIIPISYQTYPSLRMEVLTPTDLLSNEGQNLPKGAVCVYRKAQLLVG